MKNKKPPQANLGGEPICHLQGRRTNPLRVKRINLC